MIEIIGQVLAEQPRLQFAPWSRTVLFLCVRYRGFAYALSPDSLPGFLDGLQQVSIHSIHHHFIEARLRLRRMSNDFSHWLEDEVGLSQAANAIERIDIYTNSMEDVRAANSPHRLASDELSSDTMELQRTVKTTMRSTDERATSPSKSS